MCSRLKTGFSLSGSLVTGKAASFGSWLIPKEYGLILFCMATPKIKSTYSLDVETVRQLEAIARRWNVSKSEALRRAIRATMRDQPRDNELDTLDRLQSSLALSNKDADEWEQRLMRERKASATRLPD